MNTRWIRIAGLVPLVLLAAVAAVFSQQLQPVQLPTPQTDGGKPLMQALKERQSVRAFSSEKLPLQVLSNMLWAAFGVNRPSSYRTAPSASNKQEIEIYVAMSDGLYLYDATGNLLKPVLAEDIRAQTGKQDWVKEAPVNLIYVADLAKAGRTKPEDIEFYSGADTGFISQNVYLYCASEGLATVVRGSLDRAALAKSMGLRPDQRVTLAQTVGYPKK